MALWVLGEDVLGSRDIPRDSHQELRALIHLPFELKKTASYSTGTTVINCSTGTTIMTILQDQQLNSSWTAELLKCRTLVGSSFLYKYEGFSLR